MSVGFNTVTDKHSIPNDATHVGTLKFNGFIFASKIVKVYGRNEDEVYKVAEAYLNTVGKTLEQAYGSTDMVIVPKVVTAPPVLDFQQIVGTYSVRTR